MMKGTKRTLLSMVALTPLLGAMLNACSATGGSGSAAGAGGNGAATGVSTGSLPSSSSNGTGGEPNFTTGVGTGTGGFSPDAACAGTSSEAQAAPEPADIVIVIDTSGSMNEESAQVQQNLNSFASIITQSGIDAHVILIAEATVCIPAPLGSGACNGADEKLPNFRHVLQTVGSSDALQQIIATYPQWKSSLRPNASKTLAVVSDDDSAMSAADFTNQLLALDPPTFQGFKFDAIVSFQGSDVCVGCFLNCAACTFSCCDKNFLCQPISADEGKVYKALVQQTGGVIGDLCIQNFTPVFQDMATAVVQNSGISCEYPIPAAPGGTMIDPKKVNVTYTPSGSTMGSPILNVPQGASGCGQQGGWYYDNPTTPTKIVMCPSTCAALQGDTGGKVEVLFGCEIQIKPPE